MTVDSPNSLLRARIGQLRGLGVEIRLLPYAGDDMNQRGKFVAQIGPQEAKVPVGPMNTWEMIAFLGGFELGVTHPEFRTRRPVEMHFGQRQV